MAGTIGMVMFGRTPAYTPDCLIHTIRQRVDEIDAAVGKLFDASNRVKQSLPIWSLCKV